MDINSFLMIGQVQMLNLETGLIQCEANVPVSADIFDNHFADFPVLPGSCLIESMAQSCGFYLFINKKMSRLPFLIGVEKNRFVDFIKPGDQLLINAQLTLKKQNIFIFNVEVLKDQKIVSCATIKMGLLPFPSESVRSQLFEKANKVGLNKFIEDMENESSYSLQF